MKTRRINALALALVFVMASFAVACAHLSLKQKATLGLQSVETSLAAAQDVERAAYASKAFPQLTAKVHSDISSGFVKGFSGVIKAGQALKAWKAGDPVPTSLLELQRDVNAALALAATVAPKQSDLVAKAQAVSDEVLKMVQLVKGGK